MNDFKECLDLVLKSEGGWVNNPKDPGGETNLGVTKAVWEEWVGHPVATMKNLTKDLVAPLYEQRYWRPCYGEVLPRGVDLLSFSMAVNAGPGRALNFFNNLLDVYLTELLAQQQEALFSQVIVQLLSQNSLKLGESITNH